MQYINMDETVTLYRPTGPKELDLVKQSGYTKDSLWHCRLVRNQRV